MEQKKTDYQELIVYTASGSNLTFKEGVFIANDEKAVEKINRAINKYEVEVSRLGSKRTSEENEENGPSLIYVLKVYGDAESLKEELLKQTLLIDGAYIKPLAEDPEGF